MCKVYEEANIDPLKVNYFEAHATGTKVNIVDSLKLDINLIPLYLIAFRWETLRRQRPYSMLIAVNLKEKEFYP